MASNSTGNTIHKRGEKMKGSKLILFFVSTMLLVGLLAGCAKPTPSATPAPVATGTEAPTAVATPVPTIVPDTLPVTITDAIGRTVEFTSYPTKIVVAGKATTLLLSSLFLFPEAAERVVSYEDRSQTGNDFIKTAFPSMANTTLLEMNAGPEQIAPLNPDLVIMKTYMQEKLGTPLDTLGIKVVYLDLETPEQFFKDIRTIGKIFGNSARAEELVTLYQTNDAKIADALKGLTDTDKPSVLMLQYSKKGEEVAFSVPPVTWLQTMLVDLAGGRPVWQETVTDGGWTTVSLEQIAAWNPEVILIVDYKGKAVKTVEELKLDPKWQELLAVKNEKIFAFPLDFYSWDQPDSRWGLGELWLASKLHPTRFPELKMQREVTAFYKKYYGLDETFVFDKVIPIIRGAW
jgi:iron complex transport system substrate-binding protein